MNETPPRPPPEPPPAIPQGFFAEFLDAFDRRTFFLVIAVLLIQVGFVFSYVGAFHHPSPHRVPIAVLAPAQISGHLISELNAIHGAPLHATAVANETIGRTLLRHGSTSGLLIVNPTGKPTRCSSPGAAARRQRPRCRMSSLRPKPPSTATRRSPTPSPPSRETPEDCRASTWSSAGWSGVTSSLPCSGIATRPRPATTRRAIIRLIVLVPYAILSGLAGAIIVGPVLGALTGHLIAISALGALIVYCAATVTMGFQVLLGTLGVGLTLILFVVLGNPSAGGAYPAPLLPGFWRAISPALPNGAGVQALRHIVYFGSYGITGNLIIIALYIVTAITVAITGTSLLARRAAAGKPAAAVL